MKKSDIETWVNALRSGEYEQGQHQLYYVDQNRGRYCCLGVMIEELYDGEWIDHGNGIWCVRGKSGFPHKEILSEVGLRNRVAKRLARINDDGWSFEMIADWIEGNCEKFTD